MYSGHQKTILEYKVGLDTAFLIGSWGVPMLGSLNNTWSDAANGMSCDNEYPLSVQSDR
jgi:hypothetical protein